MGQATTSIWSFVFLFAAVVGPAHPFRAAVFEHAQQSHINASYTPEEVVLKNLVYYAKAALFAASKGVEVIVFPEYGIFPPTDSRIELRRFLESVPDPRGGAPYNPCLDASHWKDRPILRTLSCMALAARLILVANMGDMQPCRCASGCPADGFFHYNTNVVFAADGSLLAKYHKEHLFAEPSMDTPPPGQDPTFDTPLGRFATFVCFDLVFGKAAQVGRWGGVRAVLFPTMWLNSGPLFAAPQYFEAWSAGNDVALLAANVHLPGGASLGSVIAPGRNGAPVFTFDPDGRSKLLMADLGTSTNNSSIYVLEDEGFKEWTEDGRDVEAVCSGQVLKPPKDLYREYRCLERNTTDFALRRLASPNGHLEACHGGVCCTLDYEADDLRGDYYLGAFNGTYIAQTPTANSWAEEDCFVARCEALHGRPCVTFPTRTGATFRRVRLQARFSTDFVYPSALENGMRLAPRKFENKNGQASISVEATPLLVLGLKARPYDRDPPFVR